MTFLAEDAPVTIVPNFALPSTGGGGGGGGDRGEVTVPCLGGDVGPFAPNVPVAVPLWAALALHAMKRCRVVPPDWMSVDALAAVDEAERASSAVFAALPDAYLEVGRRLLTHCRSEFETRDVDEIAGLLESVRSARFAKLRDGVEALRGAMAVRLANITPLEINAVRPFFAGALTAYACVDGVGEGEEEGEGGADAARAPLGPADTQAAAAAGGGAPGRRLRRRDR